MTRTDVLFQFLLIGVVGQALVEYVPPHKVELALKFSEKLPRPFAADFILKPRIVAVMVRTESGTLPCVIEVFDGGFVLVELLMALSHHQKGVRIAEHLVVVPVIRSLHIRTPELRTGPRTNNSAVESLAVVFPGHVVVLPDVEALLRLKPLAEIGVRSHSRPGCGLVPEFLDFHTVVGEACGPGRGAHAGDI